MNTPAIFNPANISAAPPPVSRQTAPSSGDGAFNNVLNREIADRRSAEQASDAGAPDNTPPAVKQEVSQPASQKSGIAANPAEETETAVEGDPAQPDALSATDELLAFVSDIAGVTTAAASGESRKKDDPIPVDPIAGGVIEVFVDPRTMIDVRPLAANVSVAAGGTAQADPVTASAAAVDAKALRAPTPDVKPAPLDIDPSKDQTVKPAADFAQLGSRMAADKLAASSAQADAKPNVVPATDTTELPVARIADVAAKSAPIDQVALKSQDAVTPATSAIMAPMQQAFSAVQAAAGQATEKLTPNVGTAAWDQALGQKVVWMVAGAQTSATMTLNPPDLGPMQIVLNVSNTDATATFIAAQPEVRQALEAAMPKLREMLAEAGIQLGQASVNAGSANQNGNNDSNRSAQASGRGDNGGKAADAPLNVTRIQPARSGLGMVDTFA